MKKELEPYLPTAEAITQMNQGKFSIWVEDTRSELREREVMRDPLFHLQNEISQLLHAEYKSEVEKERTIQRSIEKYYKAIQ
ncbi:hypothetical protein [Bacillus thuringiensis]|nr:hypothetical protein [Bacillus thuringiensis]